MQKKLGLLVAFTCLVCLLSGYLGNAQPIAATMRNPSDLPDPVLSKLESTSNPPPGYEGALDDLRPVVPILYRPLKGPIGVTIDAAGARAYVIEKSLHRLVWVDIDPGSPTYASLNVITAALDDPQMAIALNAAETHAYVVENTPGKLKRIRLTDGQVTTVATGLSDPIDLALSPDESVAYVTQFYDPTLVSVDLAIGAVTTVTTGLQYPTGIALSPDGLTAYVAELTNGPLHQVNLSTGTISDASTAYVDNIYDIAVDPAGNYAYLPNYEPRLVRVNLDNGDVETIIYNTDERTEAIALSPDGSTLYGVQWGVGRLLAIDLDSATPESIFPVLQEPKGLALNRAGTRLYILEEASGDLSVQDVDPASSTYGQVSTVAQGVLPQDGYGAPHRHSVAVNPTATWALVPYDSGLRQVNLDTGSVTTVVENTFNRATGIALTADGTTAYVGDQEGIWQVDTANWTATRLTAVPFGIYALALNLQEDTIYGLRDLYHQYDLPPMLSVRLADGMLSEIPAAVGLPEGLAITWDGKHAVVSDFAEGGRLWRVDLSSGDSQLLVHVTNWTTQDWCQLGGVAIGPDNVIYVPAANTGDRFVRHGVIYAVRPGDVWRLSILYDNPFHFPEDQAISTDGNWLYVISSNSLYRVNLAAGVDRGGITTLVDGHISDPRGVAETSGNFVWVVTWDVLYKISLSDGSLLKTIHYPAATLGRAEHGLDLSGDDNFAYLATSAGELVEVNLTNDAVRVVTDSLSSPSDAAVNDARTQVYVAEKEAGQLSAVDVASGAISVVTANLEYPVSVALDEPNNQAIVLESPYPDHYISKVNLSTGVVTRIFAGETNYRESPRALSLTPDHTRAYYNRPVTGEIWGVDLTSGEVVDHLNEGINGPHGFALTGADSGAYTVSEFVPRIRHVDFENRTVSTGAVIPGSGHGLALTQDENTAYVTLFYDDELVEVDLVAGTSSSLTSGCMNGRVVLDPTETVAYVSCGGAGGTIWSVDLSDGSRTALVTDLFAPQSFPTLDINSAGTKLYTTVGNTGELGDFHHYSIDVPTGTTTLIATLEEAQDAPGDVTLSPDEHYAYVTDQSGSWIGAGVWRVDVDPASSNYGEVVSMARWIGELQHAEFTSDGRNLVMSRTDLNQMLSLCLADDCIPLEANFNASPIHGIAPLAVSFRNLSRGDYTSGSWDFGDGQTSTELNPEHTFQKPGSFTVTLTIYGSEGSDTEIKEECIHVKVGVFLPLIMRQVATVRTSSP
jgi:DNA-binding beta-propeller fold protein YncE